MLVWSASSTAASLMSDPFPVLRSDCSPHSRKCRSMNESRLSWHSPRMSFQRLPATLGVSICAPRCWYARRTFGPQLPPAFAARSSHMWDSTAGPTTLGSAAPYNRRKQVGSCRGRMSVGRSPPLLFKIHTRMSTDGPSTCSMATQET